MSDYGPLPTPAPGFYEGVPEEDYHRWDAASQSLLTELAQGHSPAHVQEKILNPSPPTEALLIGTAVHTRVLQPHLFDNQVAEAPKCDRRTKDGKAIWAEFVEGNEGKLVLKKEQMAQVKAMSVAVESHPAAHFIIQSEGPFEGSLVHALNIPFGVDTLQLRCKSRIDHYDRQLETIVDLKTTEDASQGAFERSMVKWGYHNQAGFYTSLMNAAGLPARHFVFIVVEKSPPYAVAVYKLMQDDIEHGFADLLKPMETMARCFRADEWPAYSPEVTEIALPDWKRKEYLYA